MRPSAGKPFRNQRQSTITRALTRSRAACQSRVHATVLATTISLMSTVMAFAAYAASAPSTPAPSSTSSANSSSTSSSTYIPASWPSPPTPTSNSTSSYTSAVASPSTSDCTAATPTRAADSRQQDLDQDINQVLQDWKVPGASIAVVRNNEVLLCRGYGIARQGSNERVNENTVFAIGSCTKAFTSTAIGILKDENRLAWDDLVTRYIPTLTFRDPFVRSQITIRDLLSMRSGLQTAEAMVSLSGFSSQEIIDRLKFFKEAAPFRYQFTYVNAMYILAGDVINRASGSAWQDFVTARIFAPLDMSRSSTSIKQLSALTNVASPHHMQNLAEQPVPIPYLECDAVAPAGSINSCAADLVHWLKLQLNKGMHEGKQIISETSLNETHAPQTIIADGYVLTRFPEANIRHMRYCLGWATHYYRKHKMLTHAGGIDGMRASVTILPDDRLGLVVLTNSDYADGLPQEIIKDTIVDHFLGLPKINWNGKLKGVQAANETKAEKERRRILSAQVPGTKPSHALEAYTGTFENDLYGQLKIELRDEKLVFSWPRASASSEHWHFDTFKLTFGNKMLDTAFATFNQAVDGTIDSVALPEVGAFKRR